MATTEREQLSKKQIDALRSLGEPGHFRVGGLKGFKLPWKQEQQLRALGLIEEHWTWASTTRPDCGITEAGLRVLATPAYRATGRKAG